MAMGVSVPGKFFSLLIHRDDPHPPLQVNIEIGDPDAEQQARGGHYLTTGMIEIYDGVRMQTKIEICWSLVTVHEGWLYFVRKFPGFPDQFVQVVRWQDSGTPGGTLQAVWQETHKDRFAGFQLNDGDVQILTR